MLLLCQNKNLKVIQKLLFVTCLYMRFNCLKINLETIRTANLVYSCFTIYSGAYSNIAFLFSLYIWSVLHVDVYIVMCSFASIIRFDKISLARVILATFFLRCQTYDLFYWWYIFLLEDLWRDLMDNPANWWDNRTDKVCIKEKHIWTSLPCPHISAKHCNCMIWHAADTKASWFQAQEFGSSSMDRNKITSMGCRCTAILEI